MGPKRRGRHGCRLTLPSETVGTGDSDGCETDATQPRVGGNGDRMLTWGQVAHHCEWCEISWLTHGVLIRRSLPCG